MIQNPSEQLPQSENHPNLHERFETRLTRVSESTRNTAEQALTLGEKPAAEVLAMHELVDLLIRGCNLPGRQADYIKQIHDLLKGLTYMLTIGEDPATRQQALLDKGTHDLRMAIKGQVSSILGSSGPTTETIGTDEYEL